VSCCAVHAAVVDTFADGVGVSGRASSGKAAIVANAGVDLIWRVEVELPQWQGWHPLARRRLIRTLRSSPGLIAVRTLRTRLERLVLRSFGRSIVAHVVADSPGVAAERAERAVCQALVELGQQADARARIVSTDGERPPASAL